MKLNDIYKEWSIHKIRQVKESTFYNYDSHIITISAPNSETWTRKA